MGRLLTFGIVAASLLLVSSGADAQTKPLDLFAKDADVIIRLKSPDATIEKLAELAEAIQPGTGSMIRDNAIFLGQGISNPALAGVDQSRDWYIVAFSQADAPPQVVFAIPAIDTDDMVAALGDEMTTAVHDSWVLYTDEEELPAAPVSGEELSTLLSDSARKTIDSGELSVVLNVAHLNKTYGEQLEAFEGQILDVLNNLRFAVPQNQGVNVGAIFEVYGDLLEMLFRSVRDTRMVSVVVQLDDTGVSIEKLVEFEADSETGMAFKAGAPTELPLARKLPRNAPIYFALGRGLEELTAWGWKMSTIMLPEGDALELLEEQIAEMRNVKMSSQQMAFTLGNFENGLFRTAAIVEVEPAEKMRELTQKTLESMSEIEFEGFRQTTEFEPAAESYGEYSADIVRIRQEFTEGPAQEMQQRMQEMMFGPEGMESRLLFMEGKYVQTMGGGRDAMQEALQQLESTSDNGIEVGLKPLLDNPDAFMLVDIPSLIAQGARIAAQIPEIPVPLEEQMIDNLNLQRSFTGFAWRVEESASRVQLHIATEQIRGFAKIGVLGAALFQQSQAFE